MKPGSGDSMVEHLQTAINRHALPAELVARLREQLWSLAISGNEIRSTWAAGFTQGALPATPMGYTPDDGGRAWYLFSSRSQVEAFQVARGQELIPMELPGKTIFDLAGKSDIAEITIDPEQRAVRLGRLEIEALRGDTGIPS